MSCFKNTLTTRILCTITHKTVVHNIDMTFQTFPSCKLLATFNTIYFIFLWILPSCLFKWFILEMLELQYTQLYCFSTVKVDNDFILHFSYFGIWIRISFDERTKKKCILRTDSSTNFAILSILGLSPTLHIFHIGLKPNL